MTGKHNIVNFWAWFIFRLLVSPYLAISKWWIAWCFHVILMWLHTIYAIYLVVTLIWKFGKYWNNHQIKCTPSSKAYILQVWVVFLQYSKMPILKPCQWHCLSKLPNIWLADNSIYTVAMSFHILQLHSFTATHVLDSLTVFLQKAVIC